MIQIHIIGPVHNLTNTKNNKERKIAAKTATKSTGQPSLKSYAHCSYESRLKKVLMLIPLTEEGTQYDSMGLEV